MTTITVNEKTKAGKSFLEFAKNLDFIKIENSNGLGKPNFPKIKPAADILKNKKLSSAEKTYLTRLRKTAIEIKAEKNFKNYKPFKEFLNEL